MADYIYYDYTRKIGIIQLAPDEGFVVVMDNPASLEKLLRLDSQEELRIGDDKASSAMKVHKFREEVLHHAILFPSQEAYGRYLDAYGKAEKWDYRAKKL